MRVFSNALRIAVSLVSVTVTVLLIARSFGLVPNERDAVLRGRGALCEAMAANCAMMLSNNAGEMMEGSLQRMAAYNPDIRSIGVRDVSGRLVAQVGNHAHIWTTPLNGVSTPTHAIVPLSVKSQPAGALEVTFHPIVTAGITGWLTQPIVLLIAFVSLTSLCAYYVFLRNILKQRHLIAVIPPRVRNTLNALTEGLLILDRDERIVMANQAFAEKVRMLPAELVGRRLSNLPWTLKDQEELDTAAPWLHVLRQGESRIGVLMGLQLPDDIARTFLVNATTIRDDRGNDRGVLTSFEDVTQLEQKKSELNRTLEQLRASSDEISRQNRELEQLATRDSLTGCLNRRAFFEQFERQWKTAKRYGHPLSCVMMDIDHFKQVNDRHGHVVGDQVLRKIATVLESSIREGDTLCRYGGEEFAILLPHVDLDDAMFAAERFRKEIEAARFAKLRVTASFGVSAIGQKPRDPQHLLMQADEALYLAKRTSRNRAVRWDEIPEEARGQHAQPSKIESMGEADEPGSSIPFQAVTALFSALAYRDNQTAEHCRRVADLCVTAAEGLMSLSDCYTLEIAAMLHDIGKIGVPDSILLKAEKLTDAEWDIMKRHERIGAEIVHTSFRSPQLSEIVRTYKRPFDSLPDKASGKTGVGIGARILHIADAYDAIVTDQIYRKGRTHEEAVAELRRCAGTQFDPELVERFATASQDHSRSSQRNQVVVKNAALNIGSQMERLTAALDSQDIGTIQALAARLKSTAMKYGIDDITEKAAALEDSLDSEDDLVNVLRTASELMEICRSAQNAFLHDSVPAPSAR